MLLKEGLLQGWSKLYNIWSLPVFVAVSESLLLYVNILIKSI